MIEKNSYQTLTKYLIALGFEKVNNSGKVCVWEQSVKSINFEINLSFQSQNYLQHTIKNFLKLIKDNFTSKELQHLLMNFVKENKIRFNKSGKVKILKIETNGENELETRILSSLLYKNHKNSYFEYTTPFEFTERLKTDIKNKFVHQIDKEIATTIKKS